MHIASPCSVRKIPGGEVLTTECSIIVNGRETRYVTDTYGIQDGDEVIMFQRHRKIDTGRSFAYDCE